MANRGNTGQRYKTTKLIDAEIVDGKVLHHLACGHDYSTAPMYGSVETLLEIVKKYIGKRQRCDKCSV